MLEKMFLSICELSISASLPILVYVLAAPILDKKFAAKWNYRIWIFLALWLIIPFQKIVPLERIAQIQIVGTDSLVKGNFVAGRPVLTQATDTQPAEKQADQKQNAVVPHRQLTTDMAQQAAGTVILKVGRTIYGITWTGAAAVIWLLGSVFILGMHIYGFVHYKKELLKEGDLLEDDQIRQQVQEIAQELKLRQKITLMHCEKAGSPMAIGFLKPLLVLPDESYSARELFYILKHELVHLKRRDVYFKLLFVTVNALHWFNPFVRIMCRQAVIDLELSCDEVVVQNTDLAIRKEYTETLFSAIHRQCSKKSSLSTQFYGGKQIMKKRFENILIKTKKKGGVSVFICSVVFITLLGSLTGCSVLDTFSGEASGSVYNNSSSSMLMKDNLKADQEDINGGAGQKKTNIQEQDAESIEQDAESIEQDAESIEQNDANNRGAGQKEIDNKNAVQRDSNNESTEQQGSNNPVEILAYISKFDAGHMSLTFDEVEWVTVPSKRAAELGVEDSYMDSGFYVYNEEKTLENLTVAQDCRCLLLDWFASYERMEITPEEMFQVLEERKGIGNNIPYILTVQQNKIIKVEEHYVP